MLCAPILGALFWCFGGHVGASWSYVPTWGYVGPSWGPCWRILEAYLGGHVGASSLARLGGFVGCMLGYVDLLHKIEEKVRKKKSKTQYISGLRRPS